MTISADLLYFDKKVTKEWISKYKDVYNDNLMNSLESKSKFKKFLLIIIQNILTTGIVPLITGLAIALISCFITDNKAQGLFNIVSVLLIIDGCLIIYFSTIPKECKNKVFERKNDSYFFKDVDVINFIEKVCNENNGILELILKPHRHYNNIFCGTCKCSIDKNEYYYNVECHIDFVNADFLLHPVVDIITQTIYMPYSLMDTNKLSKIHRIIVNTEFVHYSQLENKLIKGELTL